MQTQLKTSLPLLFVTLLAACDPAEFDALALDTDETGEASEDPELEGLEMSETLEGELVFEGSDSIEPPSEPCLDGVYRAEGAQIVGYPNNEQAGNGNDRVYVRPAKLEFTFANDTVSNAKVWCRRVSDNSLIERVAPISTNANLPARWDISNMCASGYASHRIVIHADAYVYGADRGFVWKDGYGCGSEAMNINAFFALNAGMGPLGNPNNGYVDWTIPAIPRAVASENCPDPGENTACGKNSRCCYVGWELVCMDLGPGGAECMTQ